ncbi:MAG: HAD family hydrolase [Dehalococcoidia bacterium]
MLYDAVLFDLDNTLADRSAAVRRWAGELYDAEKAIGGKHTREEAVALIEGWDDGGRVFAPQLFDRIYEQFPGLTRSVAELVEWHRTAYPAAFQPDDEVTRLVSDLSARGVPWGIVTNGPAFQRDKVVAMGLDKLAGCIVVSHVFGHDKPAPEIFHEALRLLGGPEPGRTLFAGDTPASDIAGAKAIGMSTAWVRRGQGWPDDLTPPDHRIDHVAELRPVLGL